MRLLIDTHFLIWAAVTAWNEEVAAVAVRRVLARQIAKEMAEQGSSETDVAKKMHTSRAALDRLLDPEVQVGFWVSREGS